MYRNAYISLDFPGHFYNESDWRRPRGKYFVQLQLLKAAKFNSNFYQTPCIQKLRYKLPAKQVHRNMMQLANDTFQLRH